MFLKTRRHTSHTHHRWEKYFVTREKENCFEIQLFLLNDAAYF